MPMTVVLMNSVVFYDDRDIKMDNSIFRTILNNFVLFFLTLLAYFVSDIEENIFSSSFISECKPWDSLGFVERAFKRERLCQRFNLHTFIFFVSNFSAQLCIRKQPRLRKKTTTGFSLIINNIFYLDH